MSRMTTVRQVLPRAYSTARSSLAPFLYSALDSTRSLLSVQGPDSTKFLQGLVSNDARKVAHRQHGGDRLIYAALLQADGRYMSDLFLHSHPAPLDPAVPSFFLDHPASQTVQIRNYLRRHVLRSKLKMAKDADQEWQVVQAWPNLDGRVDKSAVQLAEQWLDEQSEIGRDPRVAGMGWRWIMKKGQTLPSELFQLSTPAHYHLHRLSHSVPENPPDFPALPLEANLELMNGVDYKKGCYVGQELTARTYFKGVVRKRGVGIRLFREGEEVPSSFLPCTDRSEQASLMPSPSLYPTPPPGSVLTPLATSRTVSTTTSTSTSTRAPRAPRPAGKLGLALPLVSPSGSTTTVAFGSVKIDALDQVFTVTPPPPPPSTMMTGEGVVGGKEGRQEGEEMTEQDEGQGEDGKWLAKGFMHEWVEFRLDEEEIRKGQQ